MQDRQSKLEEEIARLTQQRDEERAEKHALREKADALAEAVAAYFNKRGAAHAERKGNEDIAAMADALSDYGYALALVTEAPPAGA